MCGLLSRFHRYLVASTLLKHPASPANTYVTMSEQASPSSESRSEVAVTAATTTKATPQHLQLIEAMHGTRADGIRHLARHMRRLQHSAEIMEFSLDRAQLQLRLGAECAALPTDAPHRIRLTLARDGNVALIATPLAPLALADDGTVTLLLADQHGFAPTTAADRLLQHKTTRREEYDRAWQQAARHCAFDMLFFNEDGELTEGGRSNIFVKCDGRWWTPPLSSGVLPGIMRGVLLDDASMGASERVLRREDLLQAQRWLVCNAVRGTLAATLRI